MQRSEKINSLDAQRHSLAHILAAVVLEKFPSAKLGIGPTIDNGFYYDFQLPKGLTPEDLKDLEKDMRRLVRMNMTFTGKKATPLAAKKAFAKQPFKLDLIKEFVKDKKALTIYDTVDKRTGKIYFSDLCRGGHVKNTSEINADAFRLTKIAGAYWRGDEKNPQLQRIYGIAFHQEQELKDYQEMLRMAETSDHRNLADKLQLFMVDEGIGRGLPLWLPNAFATRHVLENYMYELERRSGYKHVLTPHLAKDDLYKTSGLLALY